MKVKIERRFLVVNYGWRSAVVASEKIQEELASRRVGKRLAIFAKIRPFSTGCVPPHGSRRSHTSTRALAPPKPPTPIARPVRAFVFLR